MKRAGLLSAVFLGLWMTVVQPIQASTNLPSLGDSTSGVLSAQQEYELGRAYLKVIRSQTRTISDPELKDYLESLIDRLAAFSTITDHRLAILLINNSAINAFAAPGGIVGINTGLFFNADTEAQFAAVAAHELAHLGLRHYARQLEMAQNKRLSTAAALFASILIMATGGPDAGLAAITGTMANIQNERLKYSRQFESEADNVGIQTLVRAGFPPHAMPEIFEQLSKRDRYNGRLPEFLSSHPVTESRIADSLARAEQFKSSSLNSLQTNGNTNSKKQNTSYLLMKMRATILTSDTPQAQARQLAQELATGRTGAPDISRYGLALAATRSRDWAVAAEQLAILLKKEPGNIYYILAKANLDASSGNMNSALQAINTALDIHLDYYPLLAAKARILGQLAAGLKKGSPQAQKYRLQAQSILLNLSHQRPEDPDIWYELAEARGQANDILGLHQARAEYFFLTGNLDDAIQNINYAKKLAGNNYAIKARLDKKLTEMLEYRRNIMK